MATELTWQRRGAAGWVTLDRPKALNALTPGMVREIGTALDAFAVDPAVERIVIAGAGERAFCAGGDIRHMHDLGRARDHATQLAFWRDEYRLNLRLSQFPKPVVALIDGITMGGGAGVSVHGTYRVAGERTLFAMPEVQIGFFPDVGATCVLPRLPRHAGTWLALTGARIGPGDTLALGLATHYVPSGGQGALAAALERGGDTAAILAAHHGPPPAAAHAGNLDLIEDAFSRASLSDILAALEAQPENAFAREALAAMRRASPTSLQIALRQMREGASLTLADALRLEYRIVSRICRAQDFYEGVRAVIVDKDNQPRWTPPSIAALAADADAAYFAPLAEGDLTFPAEQP